MRRLYAAGHRVELMSPHDLADDDRVAIVSNMGAPLVGRERLSDSRNIARAVAMQEELHGWKFRARIYREMRSGSGFGWRARWPERRRVGRASRSPSVRFSAQRSRRSPQRTRKQLTGA
jgi:hypothetical protein